MSLHSIFASSHGGSYLSASLRRRVRLIQDVLPSISSAAAKMYSDPTNSRKDRVFWTKILTPCLLIETANFKFPKLDHQHDELVSRLLTALENIVRIHESIMHEEFTASSFPSLETLRQIEDNLASNIGEIQRVDWAIVKPDDTQACNSLRKLLSDLATLVGEDDEPPPPDEDGPINIRPRTSIAPLLSNLFLTLSNYFHCNCRDPHAAVLLLFTQRVLPETSESHCFYLLLSKGMRGRRVSWQETGVTVKMQTSKPKVRIILPEEPMTSGKAHDFDRNPCHPVDNLCTTVNNPITSRFLHLNLDGKSLFQIAETNPQLSELTEVETVSLKTGLLENDIEIDVKTKTCLAVVLSYALLDFCGEPWFPEGWTKGGVTLLQDSRHVFLRPSLVTYMRRDTEISAMTMVSKELEMLFHGLLLMEIFKQEAFHFEPNHGSDIDIADLRTKARMEFSAVPWGESEGYRKAVEACLDGFQDDNGASLQDAEDQFVNKFCQAIISPLEKDFVALWGEKDSDEELTTLKLLRRKKPPPPRAKPKPTHLKVQYPNFVKMPGSSVPGFRNRMDSTPRRLGADRVPVRFFHVDDSPDQRQRNAASQWFGKLDQAMQVQREKASHLYTQGKGIKIAVLDTGINMKNTWMSSKAGRVNCWPSQDQCEDADGHGTHVAYLILRMAPLAKLHIAKVSQTQLLQDADVDKIAQAIRYFSTGESRVDIINLSFGFPYFHDRLQPILDALLEARAKKVLVFAAAGNDGGNQGTTWPANLHDVIGINAADGHGNPAGFGPADGRERDICTLGEALPSCEPNEDGSGVVHRSGTSFATPIAVGIAAIVLGFIDSSTTTSSVPDDFGRLQPRLRTRSGMESALRKTCVLRSRFSYIAPWFFLEMEPLSRVGIICDELRKCPE